MNARILFALLLTINIFADPTRIPFLYEDGFIRVDVSVEGYDRPARFLLDTGATVSVIDANFARRAGLKTAGVVSVAGVGSEGKGRWPTVMKASLETISLPTRYLCLDLRTLSLGCSSAIDGLIGADFLYGKVLQIDYRNQCLTLSKEVSVNPVARSVPFKVRGPGSILIPLTVNGAKEQWFRLDTGCASALEWVSGTEVLPRLGTKVSVGLTRLETRVSETVVDLAGMRLPSVPTGVHSRVLFAGEAGLVGNGILSQYIVTIDWPGKRVFFEQLNR